MEESERQQHEQFAKVANGAVWHWLETASDEGADEAREAAYASAWHWRKAGTRLHRQRAEWLLSLVCERLGDKENARRHARTCAALTTEFTDLMRDFDIAYSYEAQMRAAFYEGDTTEIQLCRGKAEQAGKNIADDEDRGIFESDFQNTLKRIAQSPGEIL